MSGIDTLAEIEAALAAAKQVYDTARAALEGALGRVYAQAQDAADALLSQVDEFGTDHALQQYASNPHGLGVVQNADKIPWRETGEALKKEISRVVDAQDQLDDLTNRRDLLSARANPGTRTLNIQGVDYVFDGKDGSLARVGRPDERVAVSLEPVAAELSPTERFAKDAGLSKPQPSPDPSRGRSR